MTLSKRRSGLMKVEAVAPQDRDIRETEGPDASLASSDNVWNRSSDMTSFASSASNAVQ